tara:strand:- start:1763 stop:2029 length:267 start_codon:yes stop_codon:yes gene_type:complete
MPFFLSFLTFLASSLVVDLKQNSKLTKTIITSFVLIFIIYFLSNLFDALGSSSQISPFTAKIVTPIFVIFVSFLFFNYSYFKRKKFLQ